MSEQVKLQHPNESQYMITLPKSIVNAKGWSKGDSILIEVNDQGNLKLRKKKQ